MHTENDRWQTQRDETSFLELRKDKYKDKYKDKEETKTRTRIKKKTKT
jgi:hypothetical protein